MNLLNGKHILIGITGGIAAYKTPELIRRLKEAGAEVEIVTTTNAERFVSSLRLQAINDKPVHHDLFKSDVNAMEHIDLARWADLIVIAPATANLIAKAAHGIADDLLTTLLLAADRPIAVVPAMNRLMWANAATQANIKTIASRGMDIWGPADGRQACGEVGPGRMIEPAEIAQRVFAFFKSAKRLAGKTVVVTAGPTREAIDPVRFLSNRSSGKMGFAIAASAARMGARVILVSGPVGLATPPGVERIDVSTAQEMHAAVFGAINQASIFIAAAAVADYRPKSVAEEKIKKKKESLTIEFVKNPDILADVAKLPNRPFCVGFAAETEQLEAHAREKLKKKNIDMIAANWVGTTGDASGTGFDHDQNALLVLTSDQQFRLDSAPKTEIAAHLLNLIMDVYEAKNSAENT